MRAINLFFMVVSSVVILLGGMGTTSIGIVDAAPRMDVVRFNPQNTGALTWNLAEDFRVFPNQANPNPDHYGNLNTWSFMYSTIAHNPSTYSLVTQFYSNVDEQPGVQGWAGPQETGFPNTGVPEFVMNTTGMPLILNTSSIYLPGVVLVHPDSTQPAIVGWRSPFTGVVAIMGGVTDRDSALGDGIFWYIDKNSTTLASGSYPNGGAQLFQDGTGGSQLKNIPVNEGDVIYFLVAPGSNYNYDLTQLDVTINMISVSKPYSPTLVTPTNNATLTKSRVGFKWSAVPYTDRYRVVVMDEAMKKVITLTIYNAPRVKLNLPLHKTYFWYVQGCNSGGCSAKSEVWKFSN